MKAGATIVNPFIKAAINNIYLWKRPLKNVYESGHCKCLFMNAATENVCLWKLPLQISVSVNAVTVKFGLTAAMYSTVEALS